MIILFKINACMEKLERVENRVLDTFHKEQYWGLIKVFIFNFVFAHFLAIFLIGMSKLDSSNNWIENRFGDQAVNWF